MADILTKKLEDNAQITIEIDELPVRPLPRGLPKLEDIILPKNYKLKEFAEQTINN